MDLDRLIRLQARGDKNPADPVWLKYSSLAAAAVHTTNDSPQNAALRQFQFDYQADSDGVEAAIMAETAGDRVV